MEPIRQETLGQASPEREGELLPLTRHVQETCDEILLDRFRQYLLERNAELGFGKLDEFKSLVALAKLLGPDLAYELEQVLLYEFGEDSSGFEVGTGAPDLLLWAANGENTFWFFSE